VPPLDSSGKVEASDPPAEDLHLQKAELLGNGGLVDFAVRELQAANTDDGNWAPAEMAQLYLETGQTRDATQVLRLAALLGPERPETHFNLALAYERRGALAQAEQEALLSLRIDPGQQDARNTLGAIYAEEGNYTKASRVWNELVDENPDYAPARTNLAILHHVETGDRKDANVPRVGTEPSSYIRVP